MDAIVDAIAGGTIFTSCSSLCNKVFNDSYTSDLCETLCDVVGIGAFWQVFERGDIDPIYICQLLDICEIVIGGAAKIVTVDVTPPEQVAGKSVEFEVHFRVLNLTGPGQIAYVVYPPTGMTIVGATTNEGYAVGTYVSDLQFPTNKTSPTGPWTVVILICSGMCGGSSPYTKTLDTYVTGFQLDPAFAVADDIKIPIGIN